MNLRHTFLATAIVAILGPTAALADGAAVAASATEHAGHHAAAPAVTPAPTPPSAATAAPTPPATATPAMDHGNMRMQGGRAPADARDPHAYSGGHTLESGPYALGTPRQLRLADEKAFAVLLADRLEWVHTDGRSSGAYELMGRVGRDYDRLVVKAEGEVVGNRVEASRTEVLWSHAVATFWDLQIGLRHDTGPGPARNWAAFGLQGLAPYWFEVDLTAYVGDGGRTALRLGAEVELLLTQKLVLQPRVETNLLGRSDPDNGLGQGLSDLTAGLRLRYEITRQFAPYIGLEWSGRFGKTADFARADGESVRDTRVVAGLRFWF